MQIYLSFYRCDFQDLPWLWLYKNLNLGKIEKFMKMPNFYHFVFDEIHRINQEALFFRILEIPLVKLRLMLKNVF